MSVVGLLLAAGEGRRMRRPKAQLRGPDGVPYLDREVGALLEGGCDTVLVVLGAEAAAARDLLADAGWTADPDVTVVEAAGWSEGMAASLRTGLAVLGGCPPEVQAALVTLVDLPDVTAEVHARVLAGRAGADTLARAAYGGRVGHPVLLGRDHWAPLAASVAGDRGARDYLAEQEAGIVELVECGDLATGRDLDDPTDLPGG